MVTGPGWRGQGRRTRVESPWTRLDWKDYRLCGTGLVIFLSVIENFLPVVTSVVCCVDS